MLPVLTLAALLSGLTYTGSSYVQDFAAQDNNVLVGDYAHITFDSSIPDYSLDEFVNDSQALTYDLRDIERYPNFISVTFGYDLTDYVLVNFNINYGINFYMSYEFEIGPSFVYSQSQIPLWSSDGYYNQIQVPYSLRTYTFTMDIYFVYVSDVNSPDIYYDSGYTNGYNDGSTKGYQTGYTDGYNEASVQDSVAVAIFTGICEVGLLPVNVFLGILNFDVFGINIGGFVASLMTIAIVVIVLRVILGAKSKDD